MTNAAQNLLIKLGLDAELAEQFALSPELVCDRMNLDAESREQILQLSDDGDDDKVLPTNFVCYVTMPSHQSLA